MKNKKNTLSPKKVTKPKKAPKLKNLTKAKAKSTSELNKEPIYDGVKITHPNRIIQVTKTLSKLEIVEYYNFIAPLMLPHIINRPSVLVRCTEDGKKIKNSNVGCFYQKHYTPGFPKSIYPFPIRETGSHSHKETGSNKKSKNELNEDSPYLYIKNKKGLISLIQFSTLEIHSWGAPCKNIEKPDRIIFDLDPSPQTPWKTVISTAYFIRDRLEKLQLRSFVKTTGGKGLHIVIPLKSQKSWSEIKGFAKQFAQSMVEENPTLFTTNPLKAKRKNKIFIDYLRNSRGALFVAAYSTRAKTGAPISTPLEWDELKNLKSADQYTVANIRKRILQLKTDPWKGFFECRQSLTIL